ncbi:hypothetical protein CJ030_MR5G001754 [Morella rubra]|uniref:Uncharacterized protein n=1 Tax=Morella rubra TaxID=262757 RepID=A0A6A1VHG0_9ROSI|nr:hypothetical protein CJ030_MR5G001754 [Morella rubra]
MWKLQALMFPALSEVSSCFCREPSLQSPKAAEVPSYNSSKSATTFSCSSFDPWLKLDVEDFKMLVSWSDANRLVEAGPPPLQFA